MQVQLPDGRADTPASGEVLADALHKRRSALAVLGERLCLASGRVISDVDDVAGGVGGLE